MKLENNWKFKSLENLEKDYWGAPTYNSHLVIRTHELRKIPLNEFSIEDLRIMIGQNISLNYLIPLAVEELKNNPLAEGDYYPGDLLQNVLNINEEYWINNPDDYKTIMNLINTHRLQLDKCELKLNTFLNASSKIK